MTEKRRKTIVFGVLILAIIWGIWNNPFASQAKSEKEDSDAMAVANPDASPQIATPVVKSAEPDENIGWHGDPFSRRKQTKAPHKAVVASRPNFRVSVISRQEGKYMAVVNGKVVQKGDVIAGWTVAEIEELSVLLTKGSERLKLAIERS